MAPKILEACPTTQWKLIFGLSRFGGLRCPNTPLNANIGSTWRERRSTQACSISSDMLNGAPTCWRHHDLAEQILEALVHENPLDFAVTCDLAMLRVNWADVLNADNNPEQALADLSKNISALEGVLKQEPQLAYARDVLYRSHGARANILDARQRFSESTVDWEAVVALSSESERTKHRLLLALARAQTIVTRKPSPRRMY